MARQEAAPLIERVCVWLAAPSPAALERCLPLVAGAAQALGGREEAAVLQPGLALAAALARGAEEFYRGCLEASAMGTRDYGARPGAPAPSRALGEG